MTEIAVSESLRLIWAERPEKFLRLMQLFATHHQQDCETIHKLLLANNRPVAAQTVHALKGAIAFLGIQAIVAIANQLEEAIISEATINDCLALNQRCEELLQSLIQSISQLAST